MKNAPLVSILLPVRNAANHLCVAVQSILAQTLQDWECVIINDGSTDDTPNLAWNLARRDVRLQVLHQSPQGLVAALNQGIQAARGTFIARMDADDFCYPERLAKQSQALMENSALGVVSCLVEHGGDAIRQQGYAVHIDWLNQVRTPAEISLARFVDAPVAHPSVMFRRELIETYGPYRDGPFPEDYEMWLRWLDQDVQFSKVPEPLLIWNDLPDRLSRTNPRYTIDAFYALKCQYLDRWLRKNISGERPIYLWGAGRITRSRFQRLEITYRPFDGFVDIDHAKIGNLIANRRVIAPKEIPPEAFVLVGVGKRGARDQIRNFLRTIGLREGRDYLAAA